MTYIVLEGIDRSGKTTQSLLLSMALSERGYTPVRLFEPSYGEYGRKIREIITSGTEIGIEEQIALFTADRRDHVVRKITPLLEFIQDNPTFLILQDRCYLSAPAYQAEDEAAMLALLRDQQSIAPKPDIVFLLDMPAELALNRLGRHGDQANLFEREDVLEKARENYLYLADEGSERIEIVDGTKSASEVCEEILEAIDLPTLCA